MISGVGRRAGSFEWAGRRLFRHKARSGGPELLSFNHGFSALLSAGLSVVESLDALKASVGDGHFRHALGEIAARVRAGEPLSCAMKRRPDLFPALYAAAIAAGEGTGGLTRLLRRYAAFDKKMDALRKRLVSSMIYPAVLACASLSVTAFFLAYVVPSFAGIYSGAGAALPLPTRVLIAAASLLRRHIILFIAFAANAAAAIKIFSGTEKGKVFFDSLKLDMPVFGALYRAYAVSRLSSSLAMSLGAGFTFVVALGMSTSVVQNSVMEKRLEMAAGEIKGGRGVSEAFASSGVMPELALAMLSAGERSATLTEALDEISSYYEDEMAHRLGLLSRLIEPALMIVMGVLVGAIAVLMYLPVFELGGAF